MMGKRVFWFAVGVGLAAVVVLKGKEYYERFTPKGIADQITRTRQSAGEWVSDFFTTVSDAMAEREVELREATGLDG
jgi:hypothetical protein